MSKKQEFINYVQELINYANDNVVPNDDAKSYWTAFMTTQEKEKPMFTDNGKLIMNCLKNNLDKEMWTAKDIAEELFVSSRTVSGAIRKLITDGFVEKVGQDPIIYSLTELGKNIEINE